MQPNRHDFKHSVHSVSSKVVLGLSVLYILAYCRIRFGILPSVILHKRLILLYSKYSDN
jgi:hypothetical protein